MAVALLAAAVGQCSHWRFWRFGLLLFLLQAAITGAGEANGSIIGWPSRQLAEGKAQAEDDVPFCGRMSVAPVAGTMQMTHVDGKEAWKYTLAKPAQCGYGLWEKDQMIKCLLGTWIVLVGASQTNIWTVQLANMIVPGALNVVKDFFIIDGVFNLLIDIVFEIDEDTGEAKVIYKNIMRDEGGSSPKYQGVHSVQRDQNVLPSAFRQASNGWQEKRPDGPGKGSYLNKLPEYSKRHIRISYFMAEYWDNVPPALKAVENAGLGWKGAETTMITSIGLWYINNFHITHNTRPELGSYTLDRLVDRFKSDMLAVMPVIKKFCSEDGPASARGCVIASIDHCPLMHGAIWSRIYDVVKYQMLKDATPLMRFADIWTLTIQMPEFCLGGHQSPFSTIWTWQVFLSGICPHSTASAPSKIARPAPSKIARFVGPNCRSQDVANHCKKWYNLPWTKAGFHYMWECGMAELCSLKAAVDTTDHRIAEPLINIDPINSPVLMSFPLASVTRPPSTWATAWRQRAGSFPVQLIIVGVVAAIAVAAKIIGCQWCIEKASLCEKQPEEQSLLANKKIASPKAANGASSQTPTIPEPGTPNAKVDAEANVVPKAEKKPPSDRFAFGLARAIASSHVVAGHLYAKSAIVGIPAFGWGFTWVPWFFMLSGFILFSAQQRRPTEETPFEYVLRRSVNIYPLYAIGLILALLIAKSQGEAPGMVTLLLQAWLLQAWVPSITEHTLNMQCWFLCCLLLYWVFFKPAAKIVADMDLKPLIMTMAGICFLPWLLVLVPLITGNDMYWYRDHAFGDTADSVDFWVVVLKFNPLAYAHIFILGMCLARLRTLIQKDDMTYVQPLMEAMAPLGYVGLLLVFCFPAAQPPAAKLSSRLSVLLPFQSMVLLGLAGLPGFQPKVAEWASNFNFLESYSYAVYVNQFICWHLWPEYRVGILFFIFLACCAVIAVHLVQKPAEQLIKKTNNNKWVLLSLPVAMSLLLLALNFFVPNLEPVSSIPDLVKLGPSVYDVKLPLKVDGITDGSVLINPSVLMRGPDELIIVARQHRRSHQREAVDCPLWEGKQVTCMDEIWHSNIVMGAMAVTYTDWNKWLVKGVAPPFPLMQPWHGLSTKNGTQTWKRLCSRQKYLPKNRTLQRLIVDGPEDPKVIRSPGQPGMLDIAFSSYPPRSRDQCTPEKSVLQMYLSTSVEALNPGTKVDGRHLNCGEDDQPEKNWIPFEHQGSLYFVYSVLPHVVMKAHKDGTCGDKIMSTYGPLSKLQGDYPGLAISGSAQAVFVNDTEATPEMPHPHYLALFHIKNPKNSSYVHFAYRFNPAPPFHILQVSAQLPLRAAQPEEQGSAPFAFASGLAVSGEVGSRRVIISYAAGDREPRALVLSLQKLDSYFDPKHPEPRVALQPGAASAPTPQAKPSWTAWSGFLGGAALVGLGALVGPLLALLMKTHSSRLFSHASSHV